MRYFFGKTTYIILCLWLICLSTLLQAQISYRHKLTLSDGESYDRFGTAVALNEKSALVGAPGRGQGFVFAYQLDADTIKRVQEFTGSDISGSGVSRNFGSAIDIYGKYAMVGAPDNGLLEGKVYCFRYCTQGWVESEIIRVSPGRRQFGSSITMDGEWAAVGAPYVALNDTVSCDTGAIYIYRNLNGRWNYHSRILSERWNNDYFGKSISLSGLKMAAGADADGIMLYRFDGANWVKDTAIAGNIQTDTRNNQPIYSTLRGTGVALCGNQLLGGQAYGYLSVYVYRWNYTDSVTSAGRYYKDLLGSDDASLFGNSLALGANIGVIGAGDGGYTSLFNRTDGPGSQTVFYSRSDAYYNEGIQLGVAIDIFGGAFICSAPADNDGLGSVILFQTTPRVKAVTTSSGAYTNRVKIGWTRDPAFAGERFRLYRDGRLLDSVPAASSAYYDYGAVPGRLHQYGVTAVSTIWGESLLRQGIGWKTVNGSIEGAVRTAYSTGVENIEMRYSYADRPVAAAIGFDGVDDYVMRKSVANFPSSALTVCFWVKSSGAGTMLSYSTTSSDNSFSISNPGNMAVSLNGQLLANTGVAVNDGNWHHIAVTWKSIDGEMTILKDGVIVFTSQVEQGNTIPVSGILVLGQKQYTPDGGFSLSDAFGGELDDIQIWNEVRETDSIAASLARPFSGSEPGLVTYYSFDDTGRAPEGIAGDYARNSGNHGIIYGAVHTADPGRIQRQAVTLANGAYAFNNIYYDSASNITITPYRHGHRFDPSERLLLMSIVSPVKKSVNFIDTTVFSIMGRVSFSGNQCGASGVELYLNDVATDTKTDESGHFSLVIDKPGAYSIRPVLGSGDSSHKFLPAVINLDVADDTSGLIFQDTTKRILSGRLRGACLTPLGSGQIHIWSAKGAAACFDTLVSTNAYGDYSVMLSPQPYIIDLASITPENPAVLQYFNRDTVDLTYTGKTHDLIYRTAPVIHVSGWGDHGAGAYNVPIMEQGEPESLFVSVFDKSGSDSCLVSSGFIVVFDGIAGRESQPETLSLVNGRAVYYCTPSVPNILGGGVHPYQKRLQVIAEVGQESGSLDQWVLVVGHRPRTQTFTATTPEMPFLILRDPPGDNSYCSLERNSTYSWSTSQSFQPSFAAGSWWDCKIGAITGLGGEVGFFGTSVSWSTDFGAYAIARGEVIAGSEQNTRNSLVHNLSLSQTFSTSASDLSTGADGDVFVGASYVNLYALADVISYNRNTQQVVRDTTLVWEPEGIKSTFSYTESHIRNTLIPQLTELLAVARSDRNTSLSNQYNNSIATWTRILMRNDSLKNSALFEKNISFSAAAPYTATSTADSTNIFSYDYDLYVESDVAAGVGVVAFGVPYEGGIRIKTGMRFQKSTETIATRRTTVSYSLHDDDPGDFFSVDVKKDQVFGTPTFQLVGGRSSCPWETGTQPRDGVQITGNTSVRSNVPEDQQASFTVLLGNLSESNEIREYWLSPIQRSNLDGALIRVGGVVVENHLPYVLPPGEQQTVTVTVERGPVAYDYDNLQLRLYSPCDEAGIADTFAFSVHYLTPCSRVSLLYPENNWLINRQSPDSMQLILSDYDAANTQLEQLSVQYRRLGEGWITVLTVSRQRLTESHYSAWWNVRDLPDGQFELRAVASCGTSGLTYSSICTGSIARQTLSVLGEPQPADGILNIGDVIQIEFSARLDVSSVVSGQSVRLLRVSDSTDIPIKTVLYENRISLSTVADISAYEGQALVAQLNGLRDVYGNTLSSMIQWSFRVNRNPVYWAQSSIDQTIYQGSRDTITATLRNAAPSDKTYTITRKPAWMSRASLSGTVPTEGRSDLIFSLDSLMNPNIYHDTVDVTTDAGVEKLAVSLTILPRPPLWSVNPAAFSNSMSLVARVAFDSVLSRDPFDRVAAFVGGQIRGVGNLQYVPATDQYILFLTIYGDLSSGELLTFRLWDASRGWEYISRNSGYVYRANGSVGTISAPGLIEADGTVQTISLKAGWNWFSLNVESPDRSIGTVLRDLIPKNGDLVKGQSGFAQYFGATGWRGSLSSIDVGQAYMIKCASGGTLRPFGSPVSRSATTLSLKSGWNWIGYYPQEILGVNQALSGLIAIEGDRIKSQTQFSDYMASTNSWQGSLDKLLPGAGYLLRSSGGGNFIYPVLGKVASLDSGSLSCNPADYEHSMTLSMVFQCNDSILQDSTLSVAAYVNGVCRGLVKLKNIPELERYTAFLMTYSSREQGDTLTFSIYKNTVELYHVNETIPFEVDGIKGSLGAPLLMHVTPVALESALASETTTFLGQNEPNPFNPVTLIRYGIYKKAKVELSVYSTSGKRVATLVNTVKAPGRYSVSVDMGSLGLSSGIYYYRLRTGDYSRMMKMVVLR